MTLTPYSPLFIMARIKLPSGQGYFGIGIYQGKRTSNAGMLWRGAYILGASFIFTIGARYKTQPDDVIRTWQHIPLFHYESVAQMLDAPAYDCPLIGVEQGGTPLTEFSHPPRAIYLLGAEDNGLPPRVLKRCQQVIAIPTIREHSYNVAQAGTIIMYDRMVKRAGADNHERWQAT